MNIQRKYFALYNEHRENFHRNNFAFIEKILFQILILIHDEVAKYAKSIQIIKIVSKDDNELNHRKVEI